MVMIITLTTFFNE